jgi:hypothetical protein
MESGAQVGEVLTGPAPGPWNPRQGWQEGGASDLRLERIRRRRNRGANPARIGHGTTLAGKSGLAKSELPDRRSLAASRTASVVCRGVNPSRSSAGGPAPWPESGNSKRHTSNRSFIGHLETAALGQGKFLLRLRAGEILLQAAPGEGLGGFLLDQLGQDELPLALSFVGEDLIRLGVRQPDAFNGGEPDPDCLGRWVGARMRSPSGARERPDRTG